MFDPYSKEMMIKQVDNEFYEIETLIDVTLSVAGFEEFISLDLDQKKDFFENEVINKEKVFFVLDNLENIDDEQFFQYITRGFNRFSAFNRNLKVLTTSRKRKR